VNAEGLVVELEVGAPAHGGSCIGRETPDGVVYFVRHALPGERVRARVTAESGSYRRADAVEVLRAAAGRVVPPCPYAGPGRCGGCDWQHADAATQRDLKRAVVLEQFARLARLDARELLTEVEPLPGAGLLGWRTRITYAVGADGRPGLHRHRSHDLEPIERCPLGVPGVGDSDVLRRRWPGCTGVEVVRGDDGAVSVLAHRPVGPPPGRGERRRRGRRSADHVELVAGPAELGHTVGGRRLAAAAAGFWQVHPGAAGTLAAAVVEALAPRRGERVLELYAGAGALTAVLADAVGPSGRVLGIESAAGAVADAAANLAPQPWAQVRHARVDPALVATTDPRPDLVVLDPPRAGAGTAVLAAVLDLRPRAVGYVACDPAALARDVGFAAQRGWRLAGLRAFDAFPMTHHVECLALLLPGDS
jgi:tRNA/tmRNA/rRNA uracil-C5-methylase (TrmA/RlmC/RlmD family)